MRCSMGMSVAVTSEKFLIVVIHERIYFRFSRLLLLFSVFFPNPRPLADNCPSGTVESNFPKKRSEIRKMIRNALRYGIQMNVEVV